MIIYINKEKKNLISTISDKSIQIDVIIKAISKHIIKQMNVAHFYGIK